MKTQTKLPLVALAMTALSTALLSGCTPADSSKIDCSFKMSNKQLSQACQQGVDVAHEISLNYAREHSLFGWVVYPSSSEAMRMRQSAIERCQNGYAQSDQRNACAFGVDEYIEALHQHERNMDSN